MNVMPLGIGAIVTIIFVVIQILLVLAVLKIPAILSEAKKQTARLDRILKAIETADGHRREEFEAMTAGESAEA